MDDFNSKHVFWNCNTTDNNGTNPLSITMDKNLVIYHLDEHTHILSNGNTPSTIVLAITNNIHIWKMETLNDLNSDHLLIKAALEEKQPPIQQ